MLYLLHPNYAMFFPSRIIKEGETDHFSESDFRSDRSDFRKKTKITHSFVHEGSCRWNFAGSYGQKLINHILFFAPKLFWQMTELAALFRGDFDQ